MTLSFSVSLSLSSARLAKFGRVLKSNRLLRLGKLVRAIGLVRTSSLYSVGKLARLVLLFVLGAHWGGCLLFAVSEISDTAYETWTFERGIHSSQASLKCLMGTAVILSCMHNLLKNSD